MAEKQETPQEVAARVKAGLPSYLVMTPEKVEEEKKVQELRRASFTRSRLTEEERLVARGCQFEEIARANIETMEAKREQGFTHRAWGGATLDMLEEQEIQLAHGLEMQGRYEDAAVVHPHKREQARLRKIEEAINKDDDTFCDCPPTVATLGDAEIEVTPFYEVKKIYSRKHSRLVSLVACSKCPDLNATPNPPEQLAAMLGAQQGSSRAARADRNARFVSDVHLLRKQQSNS